MRLVHDLWGGTAKTIRMSKLRNAKRQFEGVAALAPKGCARDDYAAEISDKSGSQADDGVR